MIGFCCQFFSVSKVALISVGPGVAEILGGERLAVGPAMARAQVEGETPVALDLDLLGDVGLQLEVHVVPDEPGIAVDDGEARVARTTGDHPERAAVAADRLEGIELGDVGPLGQALGDRRKLARMHRVEQARRSR